MPNIESRRQQVCQWLNDYTPHDALEREHRQAMLDLADGASDPFHHLHLNPGHFTASAFVLSPDCQSLLLIFHRKLSRWLQPGGHVEPFDLDLLAAATREANEETGVSRLELVGQGVFDVDVHRIPARLDVDSHHHYDVRFLFRASSTALQINDEVRDARWVPLDKIRELDSDESVLRAVRKIAKALA